MDTDLILISEYIKLSNIEPSFIELLEENELIRIHKSDDARCLHCDELPQVEMYARMYYDLSINMEGIDVIHHLLDRINNLHQEVRDLRNRMRFFE